MGVSGEEGPPKPRQNEKADNVNVEKAVTLTSETEDYTLYPYEKRREERKKYICGKIQ